MFSSSAPETDSPRSPTASPRPATSTVAWWTPAAICPPTERLRLLPSARSSSLDLPLRDRSPVERSCCDRSARSAHVREVGLVDCARGDDVGVDAGARLVGAADRLEQLRPRFEPGLAVAHHDATHGAFHDGQFHVADAQGAAEPLPSGNGASWPVSSRMLGRSRSTPTGSPAAALRVASVAVVTTCTAPASKCRMDA